MRTRLSTARLSLVLLVLGPLTLGPVAKAEEPAFDGSRTALTLPDDVWERVLQDGGRAGRAIGYTPDELRAFGKDAHLLRNVQALFADVRKIPRESGRITTGLLENAAKPVEIVARGYGLTDVSAGRMYAPPKDKRWGLAEIDAFASPREALGQVAQRVEGDLAALPPAVQTLLVRVFVASDLAAPWLWTAALPPEKRDVVASGAAFEEFLQGAMPDLLAQMRAMSGTSDALRGPWLDEEGSQTATRNRQALRWIGTFGREEAAYGSILALTHLQLALDELRAALGSAPLPHATGPGGGAPLVVLRTRWGTIRVYGPGDDHVTLEPDTLLSLDLGGNDRWTGRVGAALIGRPVSLHVDLGGNDVYETTGDGSLACGFFGLGVLVDEAGDDSYRAERSGLGCGFFGTGLLLDRAGNDTYRATGSWCQGAGHIGVGALVDLAGDDEYECTQQSQGLGGTLGAGLLIDVAGNDAYVARDDGNVSELYLNQSVAMSQGCGYGRRADLGDGASLAGGVGVLVDGAGDDRYHAQVWAQGCGYWWGLGILEDRGGDDAYQNGKYSAGAAAHFALGVCIDLAGDDMHNATNVGAKNQFQGHARDGSIGVFVDGDGDDGYDVNNNCAGSADLNSIGLFWDRRGDDRYTFHPTDIKEEDKPNGWNDTGAFGTCTRYTPFHSFRDDLPSWGIFLDTAGRDTYANERPAKGWTPTPAADGATWKPQPGPHTYGLGYDLGPGER